jgi:hypothetical protein
MSLFSMNGVLGTARPGLDAIVDGLRAAQRDDDERDDESD